MFTRKKTHKETKNKKKYCSYQLVESIRTDRGPRQRILLNLGTNLDLDSEEAKMLANRIEELVAGIQTLIPYSEKIEKLANKYAKVLIRKKAHDIEKPTKDLTTATLTEYTSVNLDSIEHDHCRSVGVESIALATLRELKLDQILFEVRLSEREVDIAIGVIIARLIHPTSDLGTHRWLQNHTGLDELLETDFSKYSYETVYKSGDNLLKHQTLIEEHLYRTEKELFSLEDTIVLFDLTNTYFEGTGMLNSLAHRGHSKEKRSDTPLVTLGLVLGEHGFPKKSLILPGNVSEPSSLKDALARLNKTGSNRGVVVMDSGIATRDNLEYLRNEGYSYIVASRSKSCEIPENLDFQEVRKQPDNVVRAAQVRDAESGEIYLYCQSDARKQKETSMRTLLQSRFETDLKLAADALGKKRGTKSYTKVLERIGRLKEKHKRIAHYYNIEVKPDKEMNNAESLTWELNERAIENRYQGSYLLKVHGLNWDTEKLWKVYTMLTQVEEAFRSLKSDLGLRPVYHQIDRRVKGHLFITVLAYHVMQSILHKLKMKGINMRWSTVKEIMCTQMRVTTSINSQDGKQIHIRTCSRAEPMQQAIYKALRLPPTPLRSVRSIM